MKSSLFIVLAIMMAAVTGCATNHPIIERGVTNPQEIQQMAGSMAGRDIRDLMALEKASWEAFSAIGLIIDTYERDTPSRWLIARDHFRAQAQWSGHVQEAAMASHIGMDPQLAGAARELLAITQSQTEYYLAQHFGEGKALSVLAVAKRQAHSSVSDVYIRELSTVEKSILLTQALNRLYGYAGMLSRILEMGPRPDEAYWHSQGRAAQLHALFVVAALNRLSETGTVDYRLVAKLVTLAEPTAWRSTLRLKEVFPFLSDAYGSLSEENFVMLSGTNDGDVVAFATFEAWILQREPRLYEVLEYELLPALWSVFREQHPEAFTGPGEHIKPGSVQSRHLELFGMKH
jgi:hypothetical protein